MFSTFITS